MNNDQESQLADNPFVPGRPIHDRHSLFGRENAIEQIRDVLGDAPVDNPFVICGPRGVGKTSLLFQLINGALGTDTCVLYTDFQSLNSASESIFLWQLAKEMMWAMNQQGLVGPLIEKRMLVLNPQLVFRQRFWNPLMMRAQATPLLLAWDNFDSLSSTSKNSGLSQILRAYLYELLRTDSPVDLLVTITGRLEALGENTLTPFHLKRGLRLANLNIEHTVGLVQSSNLLPIPRTIAEFIARLTGGHPGDTHLLCQKLFDRHSIRHHGQVTIADVIAVMQFEVSPGDFVGDVHRRLDKSLIVGQ